MPFGFLKRTQAGRGRSRGVRRAGARAAKGSGGKAQSGKSGTVVSNPSRLHAGPARGVPFIGLTEDWRLRGRMDISGRLSDALNKREAIPITDVSGARRTARPARGARAGTAQRRPVRPHPRHRGRGQPAAADRHRANRAQGPQGRLRRGARGAAVPRRRHRLPAPGIRARPPARPLVGDVHRRSSTRSRKPGRRRGHRPGGRGDPHQPLLPARAWSRSTSGPASRTRSCPGPRWAA